MIREAKGATNSDDFEQVERLFADPRSSRFIEDFTGQWLKLKEINFTQPDVALYADFDNALRDAMVGESRLYFKEVLERNLSVGEFGVNRFYLCK